MTDQPSTDEPEARTANLPKEVRDLYLVEELWIDSMENHPANAQGYKSRGVIHRNDPVFNKMLAEQVARPGWPLSGKLTPRFRLTKLEPYTYEEWRP